MTERRTVVVDGLALAQLIRKELTEAVARLRVAGRRAPCLAVVLVGDDPASASYIKGKRRACERVGMASLERTLPADASEADVIRCVGELNRREEVDGILVQLPLPAGVRASRVAATIDPAKDVDGLHPQPGCWPASRASTRARRSASSRSCGATRSRWRAPTRW